MEVDFLDTNAKLVIELDGAQHLADANAYRLDREKDALLPFAQCAVHPDGTDQGIL